LNSKDVYLEDNVALKKCIAKKYTTNKKPIAEK